MSEFSRIKEERIKAKLSQSEIAKILNITQPQYQLYESGKREFKVHHIYCLSKFYNISADYLLNISDDPTILKS